MWIVAVPGFAGKVCAFCPLCSSHYYAGTWFYLSAPVAGWKDGNGGGAAKPWQPLLELGARLLGEFGTPDNAVVDRPAFGTLLQRDPHSGERYLRLPVPEPEVVEQLASALLRLLGSPPK